MIFKALTAAITHGYNSCNFYPGDSLGDELHSVWYCFTVLLHYYYYSYDNGRYFNPLSPNIHTQILQTDLHTFPLRIS